MIYCVDFDGTVVTHEYPRIGKPVPGALETLRALRRNGDKIILFTMRGGNELDAAVKYLEGSGIQLYGINTNPTQTEWTESPKAYGQCYIDDASVGMKLVENPNGRPYVDWEWVRIQISNKYDVDWSNL